jgi:hypothetical protein
VKPKYSEKTCPSATLSTTNPTWLNPGSNPGRRSGKPATNRLSPLMKLVFYPMCHHIVIELYYPIQTLRSISVLSVKSTAHSAENGLKTQAVLKHCEITKTVKHRQDHQTYTWMKHCRIRKAMKPCSEWTSNQTSPTHCTYILYCVFWRLKVSQRSIWKVFWDMTSSNLCRQVPKFCENLLLHPQVRKCDCLKD